MLAAERAPERGGGADARGAPRHHIVDAVPHVDRRAGIRAEQGDGLLDRLRMGLGIGHLVGAHQHVHHRLEPDECEAAQCSLPVLAGDEAGAAARGADGLDGRDDTRVHRHHPVVVG